MDQHGHTFLTDFNVAVKFKPGVPLRSIAGTEPYMAPELLSSETGYYSSVDWWSLGVVLFEMIFSDRPFRGKTKREKIIKGDYRMPNSKFSHISVACRAFISDCMQLKLHNRTGCGLEGMKKFRHHPFFRSSWVPKPPKTGKNAIAPSEDKSGAFDSSRTAAIKPIKWKKMEAKQVPAQFKPGDPVVFIRKRNEKDAEAERIKEEERATETREMLEFQRLSLVPDALKPTREYPALEKFLVILSRF